MLSSTLSKNPSRTLFIAEAGVNHNGRLDLALELVEAASAAGADVVKFQAFSSETLASSNSPAAEYQHDRAGAKTQRELLTNLELGPDDFSAIAKRCSELSVDFLCTPFDTEMLDFLLGLGMPAIKVASGELTNVPALHLFAATKLPIILSTGMATLDEVKEAVATLRHAGSTDISVLHCTSLYPAPPETLNLNAIVTLRDALGLPVGYSDHSLGTHLALTAVSLGARMIEKHITLDRSMPGPDHAASIEPAELTQLIQQIRDVEAALGDGRKAPHPDELGTAYVARRSWHATRDLPDGHIIADGDVALMRPESGIPGNRVVVGQRLSAAVQTGHPIRDDDIG